MTDRTKEIEEEAQRLEAFTRNELAGDVRDSRTKVVEAAIFLAQEMGERYEEYGRHIADLAQAALHLESVADDIDRHDERQAFTRRALANGIGGTA